MTTPQDQTASQPIHSDAVFDAGTFDTIKQPRNRNRLELDGTWHQISKNYLKLELLTHGIFLLVFIAATIVVGAVLDQKWAYIVGGVIIVFQLISMILLPRQARAYGFRLRADDIVFRKGILWQRVVAVPYGRMQLVDVTHGPLDRAFGIAQLKLVTAAATTGATIPGLSQAAAEQLRDTLIDVSESRRTGL